MKGNDESKKQSHADTKNQNYFQKMNRSKLDIFVQSFTALMVFLTVVIAYCGLGVAQKALEEYHKLNEITTETTLVNTDINLNNDLIEKAYLQSLYAIPPSNIDALKKSQFLVNMCLEQNQQQYSSFDWKDIPDLYNKLWKCLDCNDFNNKHKVRLRKFYLYSENIISLVMNAHQAYTRGFISDGSWETFAGYVRELGTHPIFLCALYGYCKNGYCEKGDIEGIMKIISEKPKNVEIINIIYKDISK